MKTIDFELIVEELEVIEEDRDYIESKDDEEVTDIPGGVL